MNHHIIYKRKKNVNNKLSFQIGNCRFKYEKLVPKAVVVSRSDVIVQASK